MIKHKLHKKLKIEQEYYRIVACLIWQFYMRKQQLEYVK